MYVEDSIIISPIIFITFDLFNNLYFCTFHICVCNMKHLLNKTLLSSGALASLLLSASLVSCQDEDFGYTAEQISYQSNFEKTFGKIAPDQIWDFSSYNLEQLGLIGGPTNDYAAIGSNSTRAMAAEPAQVNNIRSFIKSGSDTTYYNVRQKTITWLDNFMTEKHNHKSEGKPFKFINPYFVDLENPNHNTNDLDGKFLIIPIYQGQSGMVCNLHLVDNTTDYTIWEKSQGIHYSLDYTKWEEYIYVYHNSGYCDWNYEEGTMTNLWLQKALADYSKSNNSDVYIRFELPSGAECQGYFYINKNGNSYPITSELSGNDFNGIFTFSGEKNMIRHLDGTTTNEFSSNTVNLTPLVNKTYTKNGVDYSVGDNFQNLRFHITKTDNCNFNTYSGDRVEVFTKFNYTNDTPKYLRDFQLRQDGSKYTNGKGEYVSESYFFGHTINKNNVATSPMLIDGKKLGRELYMYLETTFSDDNNVNYAKLGTKHRSDTEPAMMRSITAFSDADEAQNPLTKAQVKEDVQRLIGREINDCDYMVIGCEDANGSLSDWDYNDVVLLIVGLPTAPKIARDIVQKRYLIEDLGSTFDFDFNDIVVDVTQEKWYEPDGETLEKERQTATIAHLCGTIPFQVYINDNAVTEKLPGRNTDKDGNESEDGYDPKWDSQYATKYVKELNNDTKWDPATNNIKVLVWPNAASSNNTNSVGTNGNNLDIKNAKEVTFPDKGNFPYIIAVDQDINWMKECISVPRAWFNTTTNKNNGILDDYDSDVNIGQNSTQDITEQSILNSLKNLGTLVQPNLIDNNDDETETIYFQKTNVNNLFTGYRAGNITISLVLPKDAPDYSEIKGRFVNTTNFSAEIPDSYHEFKSFETNFYDKDLNQTFSDVKIQQIKLTGDEIQSLAAQRNLGYLVEYATFPFKYGSDHISSDKDPIVRMYVRWDLVEFGSINQPQNVASDLNTYGKKVASANFTTDSNFGNRNTIEFGKEFNNTFTADQNATFTVILPANSSISGEVVSYDGSTFWSKPVTLSNNKSSEQAITVNIAEIFKGQLANSGARANTRFGITNLSSVTIDYLKEKVYVNWDGYGTVTNLALSKDADAEIYLVEDATPRTIEFTSNNSSQALTYSISSPAVSASTSGTNLTITPVVPGDATITVYQKGTSVYLESNKVVINVHVLKKLTLDQYFVWNGTDANASIDAVAAIKNQYTGTFVYTTETVAGDGTSNNIAVAYGNSNAHPRSYVDLSQADHLVVRVSTNSTTAPMFIFNRKDDWSNTSDNTKYLSVVENVANEAKDYIIDLTKFREDHDGYSHLNAICTPWGSSNSLQLLGVYADYYCPAEEIWKQTTAQTKDPRTIWCGEVGFTEHWNGASVSINIPALSIVDADTYHNRKLRIYVEKMDASNNNFAMQPHAGGKNGSMPIERDNYYSGSITDGYIDVNMDNQFFNSLKTTKQLTFQGDNLKVTRIDLVKVDENADYNLMLDNINSSWNSSVSRSPLIITFDDNDNTGCGWNNIDQSIISKYNTVTAVIQNVTDTNDNKVGSNDSSLPSVDITLNTFYNDGSSHYQGDTKTYSGNPITLTYKYVNQPITQIFFKAKNCKVEVKQIYLTNE